MAIQLGDDLSRAFINCNTVPADVVARHVAHVRQFRTRAEDSPNAETAIKAAKDGIAARNKLERELREGKPAGQTARAALVHSYTLLEGFRLKASHLLSYLRTKPETGAVLEKAIEDCIQTKNVCNARLVELKSSLASNELPEIFTNNEQFCVDVLKAHETESSFCRYLTIIDNALHLTTLVTAENGPPRHPAFKTLVLKVTGDFRTGRVRFDLRNATPMLHKDQEGRMVRSQVADQIRQVIPVRQ